MGFLFLLGVSFGILIIYFIYSSYFVQFLISKYKKKEFIKKFKFSVKGIYQEKGYFTPLNKVISNGKFNELLNRDKLKFSSCYDIIIFKTEHAHWELFFNLVKEDLKHEEILNIRVFSANNHIKSEGNVERNHSRLNIFTNNRYLSKILENTELTDTLDWLIKNNFDTILVNYNGLHFKSHNKSKLNSSEILEKIKAINQIKNKIYKKGILEY